MCQTGQVMIGRGGVHIHATQRHSIPQATSFCSLRALGRIGSHRSRCVAIHLRVPDFAGKLGELSGDTRCTNKRQAHLAPARNAQRTRARESFFLTRKGPLLTPYSFVRTLMYCQQTVQATRLKLMYYW